MNKFIKATRLFVISAFVIVNVLLLILNWEIFTASQIINLGFGQVTASPAIIEIFIGAFFLFLLWLTIGTTEPVKDEMVKNEQKIDVLEQENKEIRSTIESLEDQLAEYENIQLSDMGKAESPNKADSPKRMLAHQRMT